MQRRLLSAIRVLFWIALIGAALAQVVGASDTVNADGINYIELAQRAAAGHLDFAANGYWSPLYPALMAIGLTLARPFALDALPIARGVNVVIIVVCALAFEWLLATLERAVAGGDGRETPSIHRVTRRGAAYALFLWAVLRLQQATTVTPDLLVFATLTCIVGLLVTRRSRALTRGEGFALGSMLGVAYLAKAVMLPVGLVALAVLVLLGWRRLGEHAVGEWLRVAATFALVASPLIVTQTIAQGHLSFGETGRLNYRWYVSHAGEQRAREEPIAVTARRTERDPAQVALTSVSGAVLYAGELRGSFPHGLDPSHSEPSDGPHFDLTSQWRVLRQNSYWYRVVAGTMTLLALIPMLLAALDRLPPLMEPWPAAVVALTLLALYLLTHVEGRLCGPAIVVLLVALLYGAPSATRRALRIGQKAAMVVLIVAALLRALSTPTFDTHGGPVDGQARIARDFAAQGLRPGETVAVVGSPYGLYWAHLAGVHVAVTIPPPDAEHPLDEEGLERVVEEVRARGVSLGAVAWRGGEGRWELWRPLSASARQAPAPAQQSARRKELN